MRKETSLPLALAPRGPDICEEANQGFFLEDDATIETSGAETLKTMAWVYACYQSAEENRVVKVQPAS
jgi:hypothetical protein